MEGIIAVSRDHFVHEFFSGRQVSHFLEVDKRAEVRMGGAEDLESRIGEEVEDVYLELDGDHEED